MPYTEPSQAVVNVCAEFYIAPARGNGCGKCPLVSECHKPHRHDWDGLGEHNRRMNQLAEQYRASTKARPSEEEQLSLPV
jgi:hypothetical protein|tara:strand:- start:403 stop:642 length:240 start_codon:yes stop_codon:yes gene_type:complete